MKGRFVVILARQGLAGGFVATKELSSAMSVAVQISLFKCVARWVLDVLSKSRPTDLIDPLPGPSLGYLY